MRRRRDGRGRRGRRSQWCPLGGDRRLLADVLFDVTEPFRQILDRLLLPLEQFLRRRHASAQAPLPDKADDRQHERQRDRQQKKEFHGVQYVGAAASRG